MSIFQLGTDFIDLPGVKRKEALRLRPQPCGAESDLETVEDDFLDCRQQVKGDGIFSCSC